MGGEYNTYAGCISSYNLLLSENDRRDYLATIGSIICTLRKNVSCTQMSDGAYRPNSRSGCGRYW